ncbi:MAG: ABC transporter permease [Acidobacteriota bacterium]
MTVYQAERSSSSWSTMIREVISSRELIWRLFVRDFAAKYGQSALGYLWALGPPLVTVAIFTFLARNRVISVGETSLPYPAFVLLGLTVWGLFSGALMSITSSLTSAASVIKKMNFPRESLVFAALGQSLVDTLIRSVLLALFFAWYGAPVRWTILLVPFIFVPMMMLTLGLGFLLSTLNAIVRDVSSALGLALQFAMFLTPVVYPAPKEWPFILINYLNPVSAFVIAAHDLAGRGYLTMPAALVSSSLFGVVMFLIGWRIFRLAQPIVGERI